ncbi:hypothetical protein [Neoroseomonas soli]|uniref:Uncharacterized protein n=1 Tax=Neoroseomonas soli TaxID=1081025 RepID=A0A9X9WUE4_9PROT|nr:hypothetical protein [Neoroseomonas soli]MBR0670773.1 hypothetical protein [Neoroseomonas soli]
MSIWDDAALLQSFRRHPDTPALWLFKEEWPLGGVWELPGGAGVGADDRSQFGHHPLNLLEALTNPTGVAVVARLAWRRRLWLKAHGRRVDRALWDRATRQG